MLESSFMANLGFLGLGIMGYPMARHLIQAGHRVALWSHTAAKAKQLASDSFTHVPNFLGPFTHKR